MPGGVGSALTRRRRVRLDLLLGALVVVAVAAAILVQQGSSSSQRVAPSSPDLAAAAFARGYLGYLDGRLPARSLPDASEGVRAGAANPPPIPVAARRGALTLARIRVTYVRGALTGHAAVLGRDGAHTYGFSFGLGYLSGRWQVVSLVPPDVYTIVATRYRQPAAPQTLRRAAAEFALGYAAYREGTRPSPPGGSPTIARQIAAGRDPLASAVPSHVEPRLVSVALGPVVSGTAAASAVLTDRGRKLRFVFDLEQSTGRWLPLGFPEAG